ncbi:hypothetical protein AB1Y20_009155 [Prymnesium parvum]|uniref:Ubiquitin fusion degradation protein 1 homolog n=1 Tax=Prymnesium parvum TaxID=97485 RepID=A0AB34K4V5_PRYPA
MAHLLALCCLLAPYLVEAADQPSSPSPRKQRPAWQARLSTYSIASIARRTRRSGWNEITQGNKIVLPQSVLEHLMSRNLPYTQFQIVNPDKSKRCIRLFTGPLDFSAAEGECYLPSWVMAQLKLKEGEQCAVATACFPSAIFAKFRPHSSDFLDVTDHYSLLMRTLENFAALTAGSTVRVTDGKRIYSLDVIEVSGKAGARDDSNGRAVDLGLCELAFELLPPKDTLKSKGIASTSEEEPQLDEESSVAGVDGEPSSEPPTETPPPAAASAAPIPKFKRKKHDEQAEGEVEASPRKRREGRQQVAGSQPKFAGKARSLEGSSESDATSEKTPRGKSALAKERCLPSLLKWIALLNSMCAVNLLNGDHLNAQAREAAKLKEEQNLAAAKAAAEAAIPPWVKLARRVAELVLLLVQTIVTAVRQATSLLFTPSDVRFD